MTRKTIAISAIIIKTTTMYTTIVSDINIQVIPTGHDYIGHKYIGQNYIGHNLIGHGYIRHDYIGHTYIGHTYGGHTDVGHNHKSHDYRTIQTWSTALFKVDGTEEQIRLACTTDP